VFKNQPWDHPLKAFAQFGNFLEEVKGTFLKLKD